MTVARRIRIVQVLPAGMTAFVRKVCASYKNVHKICMSIIMHVRSIRRNIAVIMMLSVALAKYVIRGAASAKTPICSVPILVSISRMIPITAAAAIIAAERNMHPIPNAGMANVVFCSAKIITISTIIPAN